MPGASNKNGLPHYGFNDREVDFIIKAMITLAENNVKVFNHPPSTHSPLLDTIPCT